MSRKQLHQYREQVLRLAEQHGARDVRLFGSLARGDADSKSDVDLLVNLEQGRSLMDRAALAVALEDLLGRRVDVITERSLNGRVREQVLSETVRL
jgi:uncharacterized protein